MLNVDNVVIVSCGVFRVSINGESCRSCCDSDLLTVGPSVKEYTLSSSRRCRQGVECVSELYVCE
jgi:hypothetical protein